MSTTKPHNENPNRPFRVAVVGGGVTGLSVAFQLEQSLTANQSLSIDLFESSDRLGGKIKTRHQDEMILEAGAESFLSRKQPGIDLCRDLEVDSLLQGMRPENKKTFIWHHDRLHRLPEGLTGFVPGNIKSLFSSSLLGWSGKIRVAADWILPARKSSEDESLASFMTRRLGQQAYRRLVQPLLCGIYAADGSQLSLRATYPELQALEKEHGSLIRGLKKRQAMMRTQADETRKPFPPFVTFPNGMSQLIERLRSRLNKTAIHMQTPINSLARVEETRWQLTTSDQDPPREFDAVVLACPAFVSARILDSELPELAETLKQIPHVSTITASLWFEESQFDDDLNGYGFVVPSEQQRDVTAVTWTSSKHFGRCPKGRKLIRAYLGRAGAKIDPQISDEEVVAIVLRELKRFMNIDSTPSGYWIQRWPKGSPQYQMTHPKILETIENACAELRGLHLCGASYRGVGIPDCVRDAERTSQHILTQISETY